MTEAKKKCFVIMPFSRTKEHHSEEYWKRHFTSYLKPLIEKNQQLEAFRSEPLRGDIALQIITDLTSADIVVADLTDHNPNVLWELGVRQSFKHCTITIAETGTQIPFHFSHKGILFYNGEHLDNQLFEEQFLAALSDCVEKPNEPDSPVLQALGGRGTLYSIIHGDENRRKIEALKLEFSYNTKLLQKVYARIETNKALRVQKKPTECLMTSELLKYSALENLCINRYLDLEPKFYDIIFDYYGDALTINEFILEWVKSPEFNEDRLLSYEVIVKEPTKQIQAYLEKPL